MPSRVLIADDHELLRTAIRAMLTFEPDHLEVVGEAKDGAEAVAFCRALRPDLVLMDLSMPRMDGIEATRAIKAEFPKIGVMILSTVKKHPERLISPSSRSPTAPGPPSRLWISAS